MFLCDLPEQLSYGSVLDLNDVLAFIRVVVFGDVTGQDKTAAIDYYYIAKDKFWHATDYFTNGAFRSYIYTGGKLEDIFGVHDVRSIGFHEFMDEEATSVDGVDSDSEIVGYYNLNGQQIDTPTSGVVIVKYSDGKYRKVMVKQK